MEGGHGESYLSNNAIQGGESKGERRRVKEEIPQGMTGEGKKDPFP